jgi:hypothetical protein
MSFEPNIIIDVGWYIGVDSLGARDGGGGSGTFGGRGIGNIGIIGITGIHRARFCPLFDRVHSIGACVVGVGVGV